MTDWLDPSELRVGLGCMRLSTDPDRDDERGVATIAAAVEAGITVFDTARAYDDNERLLARALGAAAARNVRVVTKGGMTRPGGAWVPDGRARTLRANCEASLEALGGLAIDLYLIHAPDPRTPWRTSLRALAKLVDTGLVARVGVCNVTRAQLDEAVELAPISAVQLGLSLLDDSALRSGLVDRCSDLGITLMAHSPLGGPRRVGRLVRREDLRAIAGEQGVSETEAALAWLLGLGENIVVIGGARRPETARSLARAASVRLDDAARTRLAPARPRSTRAGRRGEVVVVMGIPGAGKSRAAAEYVARGFVRLNRDERGGTLRRLAGSLDETLEAGSREVVLDNTYLTRATRSHVVDVAARHGVAARCIWLDTPLAQAQVNVVERILERFEKLLTPEELAELGRTEPGVMAPTSQMRAFRELEPPGDDEGFVDVKRVPFERAAADGRPAVFVAAAAASRLPHDLERYAAHLVFDWRPGGVAGELDAAVAAVARVVHGTVEAALCPHGGGPPTCWCRPPLPGLVLEFARRHGVDPARSVVVGASPAHRTLANALGARYVAPVAT